MQMWLLAPKFQIALCEIGSWGPFNWCPPVTAQTLIESNDTIRTGMQYVPVLVGVNRAEGEVFRRGRTLGQYVEKGWLSHIWHTHNTDAQIGTDTANQGFHFRFQDLLGRHDWL